MMTSQIKIHHLNPTWAVSDYPSWAAEPRRGNGALISHSPLSLISDFSTKPIVFYPKNIFLGGFDYVDSHGNTLFAK